MASANLDLVRSIYADWERGDFGSVEWAHPDIEFAMADGPDPGTWTGLAGMAEGWRGFLRGWEGVRAKAEQYREIDDERVLVFQRVSARGKTSGVDYREFGQMASGTVLFHVRGGKVTRLVLYWERERAFADLGLAPNTGT